MRRPLATVAVAALLASMVLLLPGSGAVRPAYGLSYEKLNKIQRRILSGFATSELDPAATSAAVRPRSARQASPGDSGCVAAYSRDGGRTWSDSQVPTGFTRGDAFGAAREYWQGAGDPAVATDTRGNTYFACLQFNRGQPTTPVADASSAIYLYRSTGNAGASWTSPAGRWSRPPT